MVHKAWHYLGNTCCCYLFIYFHFSWPSVSKFICILHHWEDGKEPTYLVCRMRGSQLSEARELSSCYFWESRLRGFLEQFHDNCFSSGCIDLEHDDVYMKEKMN